VNNQSIKPNLVKIIAIVSVIVPTILLQAKSSQAIPLDGILDSAGKSFLQNLFGGAPAQKPVEPEAATTETENNATAADTNGLEGEATTGDL
jgi:hypothetical protein